METTQPAGSEQARLWNGPSGHAWVDAQATLDHLFRPVEALLAETARSRAVAIIGCEMSMPAATCSLPAASTCSSRASA